MLEMVTSIVTFLQTVVALITNFINGLFTLLLLIPQAVAFITTSIGYLPPVLTVFAVAGVSICVVFHIIGR